VAPVRQTARRRDYCAQRPHSALAGLTPDANCVPECIVDLLEAVEIKAQHGYRPFAQLHVAP
jgi:hypothetical protein